MGATNNLVQSVFEKKGKGASESVFTKMLENSNEVAKAQDVPGGKKVKR